MKNDQPIFDPAQWQLTDQQTELCALARELGQSKFSERAFEYDRNATFPTENFKDLHQSGLLGVCIPKENGGHGADLKTYMLMASEIGRYCGATALTFNMHVSSCLWTGPLADGLTLPEDLKSQLQQGRKVHYQRIIEDGAIYAQPFSEGGAAAAGKAAFGTQAVRTEGGWLVSGIRLVCGAQYRAHSYSIRYLLLKNLC